MVKHFQIGRFITNSIHEWRALNECEKEFSHEEKLKLAKLYFREINCAIAFSEHNVERLSRIIVKYGVPRRTTRDHSFFLDHIFEMEGYILKVFGE